MQVNLARATLKYEWKRYLAAIAALAFAGLSMLIQVGLLFGEFATYTTVVSRSPAPIWVTAPDAQSYDLSEAVPSRFEGRFWIHPDVTQVETLTHGYGDWIATDGTYFNVYMYGLDTHENSLSLMEGFSPAILRALREPNTVAVDRLDAEKLGAKVGEYTEINKKKVRVIGLVDGFRTSWGAYAFVSQLTMRLLMGDKSDKNPPYFLIGLRPGADAKKVRDQLMPRDLNPGFMVWTREDLSEASKWYWLNQSGSGASFAFSGFLSFLVGLGITSQTLRSASLANMREYAALRALGVGVNKLRLVVLEQSFWVGIIGIIICYALTVAMTLVGKNFGVALLYPSWAIVLTSLFILFIALASGVLSLRALYKSEPMELLR
jgi:putative ABC transport system permease protein